MATAPTTARSRRTPQERRSWPGRWTAGLPGRLTFERVLKHGIEQTLNNLAEGADDAHATVPHLRRRQRRAGGVAGPDALFRNGAIFLEDVFADPRMAAAVNKLLVTGFYMLNLGYAALLLKAARGFHGGGRL